MRAFKSSKWRGFVRFGDDACGIGGSCEEVTEWAGLTGLAAPLNWATVTAKLDVFHDFTNRSHEKDDQEY